MEPPDKEALGDALDMGFRNKYIGIRTLPLLFELRFCVSSHQSTALLLWSVSTVSFIIVPGLCLILCTSASPGSPLIPAYMLVF